MYKLIALALGPVLTVTMVYAFGYVALLAIVALLLAVFSLSMSGEGGKPEAAIVYTVPSNFGSI